MITCFKLYTDCKTKQMRTMKKMRADILVLALKSRGPFVTIMGETGS